MKQQKTSTSMTTKNRIKLHTIAHAQKTNKHQQQETKMHLKIGPDVDAHDADALLLCLFLSDVVIVAAEQPSKSGEEAASSSCRCCCCCCSRRRKGSPRAESADESAEQQEADVRGATIQLTEEVSPSRDKQSKKNVFALLGSKELCRNGEEGNGDDCEAVSHPRHTENRPKNVDVVCACFSAICVRFAV